MALQGSPRAGPLAGVHILDFTVYVNGPLATSMAVENGADVIKVEPAEGEGMRIMAGAARNFRRFEVENQGKLSMTLDLKHPGAIVVVERLVRGWADVVCENFRPGIMEKLGLGYEQLRAWNPRIIYASNSGFGPAGEFSQDACFDGVAQAFSGMATAQGGGPSHSPVLVRSLFSDQAGAMTFFSSILSALVARSRTGEGQRLVTSQLGATLHFQRSDLEESLRYGRERDDGRPPWYKSLFQTTQCGSDGKWFIMSLVQQVMFERLCRGVINRPELLEHPRVRELGWPRCLSDADFECRLHETLSEIVARAPRDRWLELCRAAQVPAAPCSSYREILDEGSPVNRHLRENGYLQTVEHRHFGPTAAVASPVEFHGTPTAALDQRGSWHAPLLGEHTVEVLVSAAGYTREEALELVASGVCPRPEPRFAGYAKL